VIDVGATASAQTIASAQNGTIVQCVHNPGLAPYDSAALPDSFNLDIRAQGSTSQLTVRSQDKYVAAVGPIPDHCPQTPPSPGTPDIPQTPPTPESPATDTPSHRHKGHNVGTVVGGVIGAVVGTGAIAAGCSFKIRHEKHNHKEGKSEVIEIGGSVHVG
jgi:hypothetical protein